MNANIAKFAEATAHDMITESGDWLIGASQTAETLDDFIAASASWADCSKEVTGTVAGFPFVAWDKAQVKKGDTRKSVSVIDFGDFRFVLDEDLSNYED